MSNTPSEPLSSSKSFSWTAWPLVLLAVFAAFYGILIWKYLFSLPVPSDPCRYVTPVVWKGMWAEFNFIDRVMVPLGIWFVSLFTQKEYIGGPLYEALVNVFIVFFGMTLSYRKGGTVAMAAAGVLFLGSFFMTGYATYIYADQTVALYTMLAFFCFFHLKPGKRINSVFWTGVVCAMTVFSKAPGIATYLFFATYLLLQKRYREIGTLTIGAALGSVVIFALTAVVFGWDSVVFLVQSVAGYTSKVVVHVRGPDANLVSYFQLFVEHRTLPVFLALFIFVGAYRRPDSRNLFLMAIAHLGVLYMIYTLTPRGGGVIYNYTYTGFVFAVLGASVYLGQMYHESEFSFEALRALDQRVSVSLLAGCVCVVLLIIGFFLGNTFKPFGIYEPGWPVTLPAVMRWFYTLGPIVLVGILVFTEYARTRTAVLALLFITALWTPALNGTLGVEKSRQTKQAGEFFYEAAQILGWVPVNEYSIYLSRWNQYREQLPWPLERVIRIHRLFYDTKYQREFEPRATSYDKHKELVEGSIQFIYQEQDLPQADKPYIFTDDVRAVKRAFPDAKLYKTVPMRAGSLAVMDISKH